MCPCIYAPMYFWICGSFRVCVHASCENACIECVRMCVCVYLCMCVCVCEIRYRMRNDLVYQLIQQGVDAWSGSHPPTKTLPFHGDIDLGRQIDVPANLQISFNC